MQPSTDLKELLLSVLEEQFPDDVVSSLSIESINIDHDAGEVLITLNVNTNVKPRDFAKEYFSLASVLRKSLKEKSPTLSEFLPIITPRFGPGAHA